MADIEFLNSNQVYTMVRSAYKQAVGENAVETTSLEDFVDGGIAHEDLGKYREQFTKALMLQGVKSVFMDSAYKKAKNYGFRVEDMQFKAILQAITVTAPDAQAAHNWKEFQTGDTIGTYNIQLPEVNSNLYGKTSSWEIQYDLTGTQWDDAWTSEEEVIAFVGAIRLAIDNAIEAHDEELDDMLRNAMIGECFKNDASQTAHSISVIDLREAYNAEMGGSITTRAAYLKDADALRFMSRKIAEVLGYFPRMSKLFNIARRATFTPLDRVKLQILGYAEQAFNSVAQSGTFHNALTALPNGYETVPYWQGFGLQDATSTALSVDELSKVDITLPDGTTVTKEGVVAFMADKWSILHGIKAKRTASKYHEPEDIYQYFIQTRDFRAVMPTQNAVVFVISDET